MLTLNDELWPNGIKKDNEGYAVFYPMGTNKTTIPVDSSDWPTGDKLISPFVFQNDELVGFVDTKAMTVSGNTTITMPYTHIEADFSSIEEGTLTVNAPNATVKKFKWAVNAGGNETFDFVIIDFNTTDAETINTVRTAKRVVDKTMYAEDGSVIGTWDTSKIEVGGIYDEEAMMADGLFCNLDIITMEQRGLILSEFESDLSSLRDGSTMFAFCLNLTSFNSNLSNLTVGTSMFNSCLSLTSFEGDLPSLTNGYDMFTSCTNITEFSSDLSSLTIGDSMFRDCSSLTSFSSDLPNLTNGGWMFYNSGLESFTSDLPSLTNGYDMFCYCNNLTSFSSDLSSLTDGSHMFECCSHLTTFNADLSSLTNGYDMFRKCKLDTASVQKIADTINTPSSKRTINISIGNSTPNSQEEAAFNTIASKNWTVYVGVNGGEPLQWNSTSLIPIDGEEQQTSIPFWAKPVPSDEKHAQYVDEQGNFYNILGGQFIYGDDLSTYGMFTCEEDAAANMRLTKIERTRQFMSKFLDNSV